MTGYLERRSTAYPDSRRVAVFAGRVAHPLAWSAEVGRIGWTADGDWFVRGRASGATAERPASDLENAVAAVDEERVADTIDGFIVERTG
jgi:hypothetical protein